MADLLYPNLSYVLVGLSYEVYNKLGFGYQEKYYQRAFALLLEREKLSFKKEVHHAIVFEYSIIGRYFIDFVIEDKIAVEFKVAEQIYDVHINQVLGYLKAIGLRLGLLMCITKKGVVVQRIVN